MHRSWADVTQFSLVSFNKQHQCGLKFHDLSLCAAAAAESSTECCYCCSPAAQGRFIGW